MKEGDRVRVITDDWMMIWTRGMEGVIKSTIVDDLGTQYIVNLDTIGEVTFEEDEVELIGTVAE